MASAAAAATAAVVVAAGPRRDLSKTNAGECVATADALWTPLPPQPPAKLYGRLVAAVVPSLRVLCAPQWEGQAA